MARSVLFFFVVLLLNSWKAASQASFSGKRDTIPPKISVRVLPQNFYNKNLSFFCKKEVQLQKWSAIPVFFRLGSKDYVDYLEKKPNTRGGQRAY